MAQFKLRVQLFKGSKTVDLARLGALSEELNKFLRSFGDDLGLLPDQNKWRASKFADGSLALNTAPVADVTKDVVEIGSSMAIAIVSGEPSRALEIGASERTLLRFSSFAGSLQAGETCRIGVYKSASSRAPNKWVAIDSGSGKKIASVIHPVVEHEGAVFGILHSLFKEGAKPHFDIRDVARGILIKCFYREDLYPQIVRALAVRDNRVHVAGRIKINRLNREVESIAVRRIETADALTEDDFQRFIGCAPNLTGELKTSEYIDKLRDD